MSARPRLVAREIVPISANPKAGVHRDGPRLKPKPHEFVALEYAIWIGGFVRRRMKTAPGGFVEVG